MPAWVRISHCWTTDGKYVIGSHRASRLAVLQDLVEVAGQHIEGYSFPLIGESMPRGTVYSFSLMAMHLSKQLENWQDMLCQVNSGNIRAPWDRYALVANEVPVLFNHIHIKEVAS